MTASHPVTVQQHTLGKHRTLHGMRCRTERKQLVRFPDGMHISAPLPLGHAICCKVTRLGERDTCGIGDTYEMMCTLRLMLLSGTLAGVTRKSPLADQVRFATLRRAAGALEFDRRVVYLNHARGCAGDYEDFDLFPPTADGTPEPVNFRLSGSFHRVLLPHHGCGSVLQGTGAQQCAQLFLRFPSRLQLPGRIIDESRRRGAAASGCPTSGRTSGPGGPWSPGSAAGGLPSASCSPA